MTNKHFKIGMLIALAITALLFLVTRSVQSRMTPYSSESVSPAENARQQEVGNLDTPRVSSTSRGVMLEALPPCDSKDPVGGANCTPIDRKTGAPYSQAEMERFETIRTKCLERRVCSKNNRVLPKILTENEYARQTLLLKRHEELAHILESQEATDDQVEQYYAYEDQENNYKFQVLHYLFLEETNQLDTPGSAPDIDPTRMSQSLRAAHQKLVAAEEILHLQRRRAHRNHGHPIPGENRGEETLAQGYENDRMARLYTVVTGQNQGTAHDSEATP